MRAVLSRAASSCLKGRKGLGWGRGTVNMQRNVPKPQKRVCLLSLLSLPHPPASPEAEAGYLPSAAPQDLPVPPRKRVGAGDSGVSQTKATRQGEGMGTIQHREKHKSTGKVLILIPANFLWHFSSQTGGLNVRNFSCLRCLHFSLPSMEK